MAEAGGPRLLVAAVAAGTACGYVWARLTVDLAIHAEALAWWQVAYLHFVVFRSWLLAGAAGGLCFALAWRHLGRRAGKHGPPGPVK